MNTSLNSTSAANQDQFLSFQKTSQQASLSGIHLSHIRRIRDRPEGLLCVMQPHARLLPRYSSAVTDEKWIPYRAAFWPLVRHDKGSHLC